MDQEALRNELKKLIVEELDLRDRTPASIDSDSPLFGEGLGLDSLDALQLAVAVEERFGIAIPEDDEAKAIFASVSTDGSAASSTIKVKWTYGAQGQVVKEDSKTIAPTGPAVTEFSIQKPSGWPKGDYKVEASVDNGTPTTKAFKVS